ncbi:MAG TPA: hypothetical protein VKB50_04210 [Vicinamibacterales bacterium]|nr:hypothetical protein [Vicinamibacterales bacterium]
MQLGYTSLIATVFALAVPTTASPQSIEAGVSVGNGQRGSETTLIRAEALLVTGVRVGVLGDRLEAAAQVMWLDLPSMRARATYYYGCEIGPNGMCRPTGSVDVTTLGTSPRLLASGQFLYHFRRGHRWRPFAGVGFGSMRDTEESHCDRADCVQLIPGLQTVLGRRTSWHSDLFSPVAGIGTRVGEHLGIRGGVQYHRPFGEGLSLFETFVAVGYVF